LIKDYYDYSADLGGRIVAKLWFYGALNEADVDIGAVSSAADARVAGRAWMRWSQHRLDTLGRTSSYRTSSIPVRLIGAGNIP
jgi:hypothetical protein